MLNAVIKAERIIHDAKDLGLIQSEKQFQAHITVKAKLQNEEAKLRSSAEKERNAQLIALGVFFEICYRDQTQKQLAGMREAMKKVLKSRTLAESVN